MPRFRAVLRRIGLLLLLPAAGVSAATVEPIHLPSGEPVSFAAMVGDLAGADIVLVGERHDNFAHHRAQQEVLAALHGRGPVAVAMEAFPSGHDAVLERWSGGEITGYTRFLEEVGWYQVWGVDPALYRSVLETVRRHRLPLVGMNIPRQWIQTISREGMDALSDRARDRIGPVAAPSEAYREALRESLAAHGREEAEAKGFIRAQTAWDAAMAGPLLATAKARPDTVVVGLVGMGHLRGGFGIPHQLRNRTGDLTVRTVLPFDPAEEDRPQADDADYAWPMTADRAPEPVRLGVGLDPAGKKEGAGVPVTEVVEDSSAAAAGVAAGDRILAVDGEATDSSAALIHAIRQHRWGGCLRLTIRREGEERELTVPLREPEPASSPH